MLIERENTTEQNKYSANIVPFCEKCFRSFHSRPMTYCCCVIIWKAGDNTRFCEMVGAYPLSGTEAEELAAETKKLSQDHGIALYEAETDGL